MKTFVRPLIFTLIALVLWSFAPTATASHFRFANLSWKRAPGANPLAVEITVTEAWRISSFGNGEISYDFGDNTGSFSTSTATLIATLADIAGEQYEVWRYTTTHTYPSNGVFTVSGSSCCRIGSLLNATGSESFAMLVDLRDPANTGSPVATVPVILQVQAGTNNSIALPIVDPDGDPFTVRVATGAESSIFTLPTVGTNVISVTPGGVLNWNTEGGSSGQKFALQVIIEERRAGNLTGTNGLVPLDFIIELAGSLTNLPPTVTGTNGSITLTANQTFTTTFVGTDPEGGPLRVNHQGLPPGATISPADGTTNSSPASVTFSWTPAPSDVGSSYAVLIFFTDQGGLQRAASFALTVAATTVRDFELLSINSGGTASGSGASLNPVVSSNGQYVAFVSDAGNLVTNDNNSARDVFWRDRVAGTTRLVSRTTAGASGNADSDAPVISPDGRYVAFHSRASNLVATDSNTNYDVFVWDSNDNSVTLVSRTLSGASGAGDSYSPQLSASGRVVSFASTATDLAANDTNGTADAFARDLDANTTYLASINTNNLVGNGASGVPVLSANGRYVAFLSRANDLVTNDLNALNDVFVHDLQTRVTKLVSVNVAGTGAGNRLSFDPVISADGRYIAFASQATNLVTITDTNDFPDVFVRDMQLGATALVSVNGSGTASGGNAGTPSILPASFTPFLSADGTKVLFASLAQDLVANDSNGKQDVFLRDHINNTTTLISTNRFGTGSGNAASGLGAYSMSADLRYVAFFSEASNVGTADTNSRTDVFLRDLATNSTKIISRVSLGGFAANGHSFQPVISADGSTILFTSEAENLDTRDGNAQSDVFAAATTLGPPNFGVVDVGISITSVSARTVGSPFTLVVTVTNHSASPATGLVVGNSGPEFLQYLSGTVSQGTLTSNNWVVGDLAANGSATATLSLVATNLGEGNLILSFDRRDQLDSNLNNNAALTTITANQTAAGALFYLPGTTAYLSRTNSPFFASLLSGAVTLENFESGALSLAGVTASAGSVVAPAANTDSVDADDGTLDGFGTGGRSFFVTGTNAVTFFFNPAVLGRLPTKVGIVLTDGDHEGAGIEAFDTNGVSLGVLGPFEIGDQSFFGETAEDRFLGVEFAGGISALKVFYLQPGFELDHLQFDVTTTDLQLTGTAPGSALVGGSFTTTLSVTNLGLGAVTSAVVTNADPGPIQLVSAVASQGAFDGMTGTWNVGGLAVGAGATLTLTIAPTNVGQIQFYSRVLSEVPDRNTANDVVTATVLVPNQAPGLTFQTNNVVVIEDAGPQTVAGFATFSGPEPGQMLASASVTNDNPALFAVQPAGTNGVLTFTSATNANGSATVMVIVQDDGGTANSGVDRTTNTFTITVTAVNDAPVISFTTNSLFVAEDSGAQTLVAFATFATVEAGQAITNATATNSNPALFSVQPYFTVDGTLRFTSAADASGTATVTVVVQEDGGTTDGGVDRATNTFSLVVVPVNVAPSFTLTAGTATEGVQDWVRGGSVNSSFGVKVITDASGNVIVASDEVDNSGEVTTYQIFVVKYSNIGVAQWTNTIPNSGGSSTQVRGLAVDSTGAVILAAKHSESGTDFLTMKYAADGSLVWSNRFDALGNDEPMAVAVDGNNKVIVTGKSEDPGSQSGYTDFLTVKYLADGTPFWTNRSTYAGPGHDVPRSVAVDAAGDVFVTGDGSNTDYTYAYTLKLAAATGVPVWTNQFDLGGENSTAEAVRVDGGGDVIVAGTLNAAGGQSYFGVVKYSSAGAVTWTNLYARNTEFQHVHGLAVDSSGNAIITGNTEVSANMDFTTVKYLADGTPAWTNHYDGAALGRDHPNAISVNAAGDVFVTGDSAGDNSRDWVTVKYTAAGVGVWTNRYDGTGGGNDTPNAVATDASGNAFVTGEADSVTRTIKYALVPPDGANQTVTNTVGAVTVSSFVVSSSVGPANESTQTLSFVVTNDNPGLFTVQPAISAGGVLTYTVGPAASGLATVTVRAQDTGGTANGGVDTSAAQAFNLTVLSGNGAVFYVWLGGAGDWNDPAAWTPRGVPGVADSAFIGSGTVLLTNIVTVATLTHDGGTLGGAGSVTVRSNMTWTGGVMSGAGTTTIASGATLTVSGAADKSLNRRLDNYGTVTWTEGRIIGDSGPVINNATGALFDSQTDSTLFESNDGSVKTFNNSGTVRKSVGTSTSQWRGVFNNNGAVNVQTGTLNPTDTVNLNTSSYSGAGRFLFGSCTLNGTLTVAAGANVEFDSGTLLGTGTIVGTMNWTGGVMGPGGITTIASNSVLLVSGGADKSLNRRLDNYGTVTWTTGRIIGDSAPVLNNYAGALFDAQSDATLFESNDGSVKTFNNSGTVRKSAGTGTSIWQGLFNNGSTLNVQTGTLALAGGGESAGAFTNAAGAMVDFTGGTLVLNNGASFSGAGLSRINGGTVNVSTGATVAFTGSFELASGTLGGAGTFSVPAGSQLAWTGGVMAGAGTTVVASSGVLVASGTADKSLNRRLDNYGTVTWTGGRIIGDSTPVLNNFAGALFDTQTDTTLFESNDGSVKTLNNSGTVRKSAGPGISQWRGVFNNNGAVNVQTGTLNPTDTVNLNTSSYSGAGRLLFGSCTLNGTLTVAAGANVEFGGGTLSGTGTIVGTLNWTGGVMGPGGITTIAANGVLVASGGADKSLNRQLENYGTVTWTAGRIIGDSTPVLNNYAGALFDVQTDSTLFESNDGSVKTFNNSGTVRKSVATGTSTWLGVFNNSGALELQRGIVSLAGNYAPAAGSSLKVFLGGLTAGSQFGQLLVTGTATLTGTLNIVLTNSFVPVVANTFLVVSSGVRSGTFSSVTGSDLGGGLTLDPTYLLGDLTLVATGVAALPPLVPQASGADRLLRWPGGADGYELQTATSITGPWTPVLTPVAQENGDSVVRLPAGVTRFYRLVRPAAPRPDNNPIQ